MSMKVLRQGDPCPCCGQPIKTDDEKILRMLGWVWENGRLPTLYELKKLEEK